MAGFLVDEDLPNSLAEDLRHGGHKALHVREVGLAGRSDQEILTYAIERELAILTSDVGFGALHLVSANHFGIMVGRFHETLPIATRKRLLLMAATSVEPREFVNSLLVVEPGSLRRHRKAND